MIIKSKVTDRKALVKELCSRLDLESKYLGAPSFGYQVGDYKVVKNGDIEVEDEKAEMDFIRELVAADLVEDPGCEEELSLSISVPLEGHSEKSIVNLLHIFCSREKLINRSVGCNHAFCMNKKFVDALDKEPPESVEEIYEKLDDAGGADINRGIMFEEDKITFTGFPQTKDPDLVKAYLQLVELINKSALTQQRVVKDKNHSNNEKYAFRVWLIRMGMVGDDYKLTRKLLLKNMPGNSAFRTNDQAEAFKEKMKEKREEARQCSEYQTL